MKEKPILFSGEMVRAILAGRKTQTRRVVRYPHSWLTPYAGGNKAKAFELFHEEVEASSFWNAGSNDGSCHWQCGDEWLPQNYQVGELLWVKETHSFWSHSFESVGVEYAAGGEHKIVDFPDKVGMPSLEVQCRENLGGGRRKRPSIFMPRWASRITLEIVGVHIERLKDISNEDYFAEGLPADTTKCNRTWYGDLWEEINGKGSWDANPWVWVVTFSNVECTNPEGCQ
jgi:hypothetical protein